MGSMAYVGGWTAVLDMKGVATNEPAGNAGPLAWLFWRSAYFTMSVSMKNKILIPGFWFLTWIYGRDISNIK
jgi:NADH dehydrogenase FAD-containing subunit